MDSAFKRLLTTEVQFVKGVGPKLALLLGKLGIRTVAHLLLYLPYDYEDRRTISTISGVRPGIFQTFIVKIGGFSTHRTRSGRSITSALAYDNTGTIELTWFNAPKYLTARIHHEENYFMFGKADFYNNSLQIAHPEITPYEKGTETTATLLPVYGLTEGLNQNHVRAILRNALDTFLPKTDFYPHEFCERHRVISIVDALRQIHFPENDELLHHARRRLVFDEFLSFNYLMAERRSRREIIRVSAYIVENEKETAFREKLPFTLTDAQERVIADIQKDICSGMMMYRLIQGDVGSGKTVVAAYAMFAAWYNGKQAALMAPTSILAQQHFIKIHTLLTPLGVNVRLLIGATKKKEKEEIREALIGGTCDVLIGTHALIVEQVAFAKLGLVVVDEQHKFGVEQRKKLQDKGENVHYLVMTATPIPRTTALVYFGDTDISIIDQLPAGRKIIKTVVRFEKSRFQLYEFIKKEITAGHQVYAVYPLVEDSDTVDLKSAQTMYTEFADNFGKDDVALLHGKMTAQDKNDVMERFLRKEIHVLVATTVIEVGVDSPHASVLVIEHPERFGLAQLHQLRGRVGRSDIQSYCVLLVSNYIPKETLARLNEFSSVDDGFRIAELDLEYRGGGKMLGKQQHGEAGFRIGSIVRDKEIFYETKTIAEKMRTVEKRYWDYDAVARWYFPDDTGE